MKHIVKFFPWWTAAFFALFIAENTPATSETCASRTSNLAVSDDLLRSLSKDLAEVDLLVENLRRTYTLPKTYLQDLEFFIDEAHRPKFVIKTPSKSVEYDVLQKTMVEIPTEGGPRQLILAKINTREGPAWAVLPSREQYLMALCPRIKKPNLKYPIYVYDLSVAREPGAQDALVERVATTEQLSSIADKIYLKLSEIAKKYLISPVRIEGFTLSLPDLSVQIHFKIRKSEEKRRP